MDPITQQQALAAAGAAGGDPVYVDDVFSTYVYEGTGGSQTITNGIDLDGEGGLVWIKGRHQVNPRLHDSERGANASGYFKALRTDGTNAEYDALTAGVNAFNSNGFGIGGVSTPINSSGENYVSWTFRKAPGFFDVVTYTGNGVAGREIAHNLGSVPGMVIVKRTNDTEDWTCYHRELWPTYVIDLSNSDGQHASGDVFNSTAPTASVFTVGSSGRTNANGSEYVAYIFAHDDQSFGTNSNESIIKCGRWDGTGSKLDVNLGWEPQWVMLTSYAGDSDHWYMYDSMRGFTGPGSGDSAHLRANLNSSEGSNDVHRTSTGFQLGSTDTNKSWGDYIYIAIRRPHKPPETGTEVFAAQATRGATNANDPSTLLFTSGFPVDLMLQLAKTSGSSNAMAVDRLRWDAFLRTSESAAEISNVGYLRDHMEGIYSAGSDSANSNFAGLLFKRAAGFFDMVAYEGTGSATTINHNLGAVPKMIIVKKRDSSESWSVYHEASGNNKNLWLNDSGGGITSSRWNNTTPTDSVFSVGTDSGTNSSGGTYIAYLFGDVPGISKVGSYTGTATNGLQVDCGFTNGARFVMVKRFGGTGGWFVWDTARGINAGNDPYVQLDVTNGEYNNQDFIDPYSAGFIINGSSSGSLNASGGTYLFLAIA